MTLDPTPAVAYGFFRELDLREAVWRTFDHHYLLYAARGTFHLEVATRRWLLPPHRAAWIAAEIPIRVQSHAPVQCCSVLFPPSTLAQPTADCRVFGMSPLAREMIRYAMRWDQTTAHDLAAQRFLLALADVCVDLAQQPDPAWLPQAQSAELQRAMHYTYTHLAEQPNFQAAAAAAALSERSLARRFATETQMTWRQFVQRARIVEAASLLAETNLSVQAVAEAVGFESVSAFTNAFRTLMHATPTMFRDRLQTG